MYNERATLNYLSRHHRTSQRRIATGTWAIRGHGQPAPAPDGPQGPGQAGADQRPDAALQGRTLEIHAFRPEDEGVG